MVAAAAAVRAGLGVQEKMAGQPQVAAVLAAAVVVAMLRRPQLLMPPHRVPLAVMDIRVPAEVLLEELPAREAQARRLAPVVVAAVLALAAMAVTVPTVGNGILLMDLAAAVAEEETPIQERQVREAVMAAAAEEGKIIVPRLAEAAKALSSFPMSPLAT
jgi:hypothetical protein